MKQKVLFETETRQAERVYSASHYKVVCLREVAISQDAAMLDNPRNVEAYWHEAIASDDRHNADVENLYVIHLNTRLRPIGHVHIGLGTLDTVLMSTREVFRAAIVANAHSIVLMHNHPSGDCTPSEADVRVTRTLIKAAQIIGIEIKDHVVIGAGKSSSLRELGYLYQ